MILMLGKTIVVKKLSFISSLYEVFVDTINSFFLLLVFPAKYFMRCVLKVNDNSCDFIFYGRYIIGACIVGYGGYNTVSLPQSEWKPNLSWRDTGIIISLGFSAQCAAHHEKVLGAHTIMSDDSKR